MTAYLVKTLCLGDEDTVKMLFQDEAELIQYLSDWVEQDHAPGGNPPVPAGIWRWPDVNPLLETGHLDPMVLVMVRETPELEGWICRDYTLTGGGQAISFAVMLDGRDRD